MGRKVTNLGFNKAKVIKVNNNNVIAQRMKFKLPKLPMMQNNDSRLVYLSGEINEELILEIQQQLLDLSSDSKEPIHLVISTYGGSVHEMFSLYDVIKFIPSPVYTVGLGKVMSAGSLILSSGEKGHRMIGSSTKVMIHALQAGLYGNFFEMVNDLEAIKQLQDMYVNYMVKETNLSNDEINNLLESKVDNIFTAEQALKMGIVDKII